MAVFGLQFPHVFVWRLHVVVADFLQDFLQERLVKQM